MRSLDPKIERVLATILGLVLVTVIVYTVSDAMTSGLRFVQRFPKTSQAESVLGGAYLIFMISATDWPATLRNSPFVRVQLQCWTLWLFLLGVLLAMESSAFAEAVEIGFLLAICFLAAVSLFSLFRPPDLF